MPAVRSGRTSTCPAWLMGMSAGAPVGGANIGSYALSRGLGAGDGHRHRTGQAELDPRAGQAA
jgi:hypothetical protein